MGVDVASAGRSQGFSKSWASGHRTDAWSALQGAGCYAGELNCRQANGPKLSHIELQEEGTVFDKGYALQQEHLYVRRPSAAAGSEAL